MKLLDWYLKNRRNLPWRQTRDPYCIWISEVMLQQTQVDTVIPYYHRFIGRLPNVETLARANLSEVLKIWEGMGYYARARNLHKAAKVIVNDYVGIIPDDYKTLRKLPGVGEYTAAAIASIAFYVPIPILDGNARRVFSRLIGWHKDPASQEGKKALIQIAKKLLSEAAPGDWNQAIMELGAIICLPKNPNCNLCPVNKNCKAYATGESDKIPLRIPRGPLPHYQVTAGLIWQDDVLLIARRHEKGLLGGLWEFPGGKQEDNETLEQCLERELVEELAIRVEVGERFCRVDHAYTHLKITLHVFQCRYIEGPPKALGCAEWKWIKAWQLKDFAFPKADRVVIDKILLTPKDK